MCKVKQVFIYDNSNDESDLHEQNVAKFFEQSVDKNTKLFKTNAENLFDIYLNNLPEEARQYYNCNACKNFINRYGGIVRIDEKGNKHSVVWNLDTTPEFFKKSVKAILEEIEKSKVVGMLIPEERRLGFDRTGKWTHLHVFVPKEMIHNDIIKTAYQVEAEKIEEFKMLNRALQEFELTTVKQAVSLLKSDVLYRGDKVFNMALWFEYLKENLSKIKKSEQKRNYIWLSVANAPKGYTHIKNTVLGSLLEDISSGMSIQFVISRFNEKMNPSNYQRSKSLPSAKEILEAERVVQELGIGKSLQRRYAKLEEVNNLLWKKSDVNDTKNINNGGVFSHLLLSENISKSKDTIPNKKMTWEKFSRTVLPVAESIEVLVDDSSRLMALITAEEEDAPNILKWDNPFSWYYNGGGIDAEIKRRVETEGGKYEGNEIRCSLIWEGYTDLDLHCYTPKGEHIYFRNKNESYGDGYLDLDMNGLDKESNTPVENMRWVKHASNGKYKFFVHNYRERSNLEGTPFKVELEVNGQIYAYEGKPLKEDDEITVFEFEYEKGQKPRFISQNHSKLTNWSVNLGSFVKVNAITMSPNLWGEKPVESSGHHIFFLLDGVKDESHGMGKGFLNEMLKDELKPIRKTLELFTDNTPINGYDEATAFGVGYSKDMDWNLTLRVTTRDFVQNIVIDRFD